MRKLYTALFFVALVAAALFYFADHKVPSVPAGAFFVVSADGPAQPGQTQELLINVFSRQNGNPKRETSMQLSASLHASAPQLLEISDLKLSDSGAYICRFAIPEAFSGSATLQIFQTGAPKTTLFSCQIPVEADNDLVVLPPAVPVHPGNWLSFRIASINRKTGAGNFKVPIRVKMHTPGRHQTINRVLQTDIHGTAVFTTHMHEHATPGCYEFEFVQGKTRRTLELAVQSAPDRSTLLKQLFQHRLDFIQPVSSAFLNHLALASPPVYLISSHSFDASHTQMLSEIRPEIDQAFLAYDCSGSEHRQIEVWQNGNLIYNSGLQLASGRISIPFPHPVDQTQPLFFRIWQMGETSFRIQEKAVLPGDKRLTPAIATLKDTGLYLDHNSETDFSGLFFTRPGFFASSSSLKLESMTSQGSLQLKLAEPSKYCHILQADRLAGKPGTQIRSQKRFFLVENELNLSRYRFATMKIWLEPEDFFSSLIAALRSDETRVDFLIGEAECRALRFNCTGIEDQAVELEKLEGCLAILTELFVYATSNPEQSKAWNPALIRAIRRLDGLVHIPVTMHDLAATATADEKKIGPFSPVLPYEISIDKLFSALKPGGKVSLSAGGRTIPMTLSGNATIYGGKNLPGHENHLEKLTNLRSIPIIVELDFANNNDY